MNDNNHHITYTAADIRRYVQGELSPQEMHAMEKAALEDPFLADAMEGMQEALQQHGEPVVTAQLQELRNTLQTRTGKKNSAPVIAFRWWQAAAAAVIVIAGALWIYNYSTTNNETTIVAKQQEAPEAVVTQAKQDSFVAESKQEEKDAVAAVQPPKQEKPRTVERPASQAAKTPAPPMAAVLDTARAQANALAIEQTAKQEAINRAGIMRRQAFDEKKVQAVHKESVVVNVPTVDTPKKFEDFNNADIELITVAAANDSQRKSVITGSTDLSGVVKGRVTDPFHNPVANARITLPNNASYHMLTDKRGYFQLPANDTAVDVAVNVTGYGTQNFRLQNNASLNELQLQPANAGLAEVVVAGYGARSKKNAVKTNYPKVMVQDAEPVFGWMAYEQYLEKNKQRPVGYPGMKGNVVVSFMVNKKGTLSNFNIEQSLAKPYDEEAIRLISQGPAWKLVKGRKAKITVIVKF